MNQIDTIYSSSQSPAEFCERYIQYSRELLAKIDNDAMGRALDCLMSARNAGHTIYTMGNGGSAASANHFANDIAIGTRHCHPPFNAISLSANIPIISAIANDDGYDKIFSTQLSKSLRANDVVIAISASGNSPNIVEGVNYARDKKATVIGLTGFDGGRLKELCDISIHIDTNKGEYGHTEDLHAMVGHMIGAYLMKAVLTD